MSVKVIAEISQKNDGDFPVVDANSIKGGHYQVDKLEERNNIPEQRRREGMLCFVKEDHTTYQLVGGILNDNWSPMSSGGGGGGPVLDQLRRQRITIPQTHTTEQDIMLNQLYITTDKTISPGPVTVLDPDTGKLLMNGLTPISGEINEYGQVNLSEPPRQKITIVYGTVVRLESMPQKFLKEHFYTEEQKQLMVEQKREMQKVESEITKEQIKPTGIYARMGSDYPEIVFSYADHPDLSHFVVERYNEYQETWEPYDGDNGIVRP